MEYANHMQELTARLVSDRCSKCTTSIHIHLNVYTFDVEQIGICHTHMVYYGRF